MLKHYSGILLIGGMGVLLMAAAAHPAPIGSKSDTWTVNLSQMNNVNNADMRGFDPSVLTSAADLFPDVSRPCCLQGSSLFGNGINGGGSGEELNQNCTSTDFGEPIVTPNALREFSTGSIEVQAESAPFPTIAVSDCNALTTGNVFQGEVLFQSNRNGLLSRPQADTINCDTLGSLIDGNRCNEITFGFLQDVSSAGQILDLTFTIRSLTDADGNLLGSAEGTMTQTITDAGVEETCSGTFTVDESTGFVMTAGSLQGC